jgi:CubicO group peptidase (beta-lactamase class C family)
VAPVAPSASPSTAPIVTGPSHRGIDLGGAKAPPHATTVLEDPLDAFVESERQRHHRVGVSVAVVKNDALLWARGYGLADVEAGRPATADTIYLVSSMSKAVMAVAVMQAVEQLADARHVAIADVLDADVDDLVGLRVRNPSYPNAKITLRMILSHVSSIQNDYDRVPHDYPVTAPAYDTSAVPALRPLFASYLTPGAPFFSPSNFLSAAPATSYVYSSVAAAAAGLVVEALGPFDPWCRTHIFEPLHMQDTAWRLSELTGLRSFARTLAMPYQWNTDAVPEPKNELADGTGLWENTFYPAASLRSTVVDFARLARALMADGQYQDADGGVARLLRPETLREMHRAQFPALEATQGLVLYATTRDGLTLWGHEGANDGFRSGFFYMPGPIAAGAAAADGGADAAALGDAGSGDRYGVVVLTNGDYDGDDGDLVRNVAWASIRQAKGEPVARPAR